MKVNEARPFFRVLATLLAIPFWFFAIVVIDQSLHESSPKDIQWKEMSTAIVGSLAFSYVAITGYMPRFLLDLFSRGRVADDEDYKRNTT